jgi:sugar/nucleoside kinase (ribokinase family)
MPPESPIDVCVLGHVTRDVIREGAEPRGRPGGAAYYGAAVLARFGLKVRLITRLAPADADLLAELARLGLAVTVKPSAATTVFEAVGEGGPDERTYRALSVADPFMPGDVAGIAARAVLMDPLTAFDGFAALLSAAAKTAPLVALDAQGFVRKFILSEAPKGALAAGLEGFRHLAVVKADAQEAKLLTGKSKPEAAARALAKLGPREVIVTMGSHGSLLLAEGALTRIPAFPPSRLADPTGAGDSYLAAYVAARLNGKEPPASARFGAAVAAMKLERAGAFAGSRAEAEAFLARQPS